MTFEPFSKSATNAPNITIAIPDAPLSGAIRFLFVIFGAFVADFENYSNVIGTFWHFLELFWHFLQNKSTPSVPPHLTNSKTNLPEK